MPVMDVRIMLMLMLDWPVFVPMGMLGSRVNGFWMVMVMMPVQMLVRVFVCLQDMPVPMQMFFIDGQDGAGNHQACANKK